MNHKGKHVDLSSEIAEKQGCRELAPESTIMGISMPRMLTEAVCCSEEFRRTEVFIIIHVSW